MSVATSERLVEATGASEPEPRFVKPIPRSELRSAIRQQRDEALMRGPFFEED